MNAKRIIDWWDIHRTPLAITGALIVSAVTLLWQLT